MATILFVSEFCLLDRKSGAALSASAMLQALAAAGHDCHAATLSLFDGQDEYPLPEALSGPAGHPGHLTQGGVSHAIHRTFSTRVEALRPWESEAYVRLALAEVARLKPDLVLTYGGRMLWPVLRFAQLLGARTVFYVANASWAEREEAEIRHIDNYIMPSRTMADYFCEKKGVPRERTRIVRSIVDQLPAGPLPLERIGTRHQRFVTMVNPQPAKGGAFFLHLAAAARRDAHDLRFMVVESRWGRSQWERLTNVADLDNLRWHPTTQDMAAVYRQSALLLMPTLVFEASGRVIPEAMQAGLPVLAMDRGGIAEQLDGGGFLFDCPAELIADPLSIPAPAVLDQWLHFIRTLMRHDDIYTRAVNLALAAAERARPDVRRREAVEMFEALLALPAVLPDGAQADVHHTLIDMRTRMQGLLDAAVDRDSASAPIEDLQSTGIDRHPYREVLRFSLAQPAMREAVSLLRDGEHDAARDALEQYVRAMPMDYQALLLLADLFARQGSMLLAQAVARRAVDLAPAAAEPRLALVRYLAASGEDDEARSVSSELSARFSGRHERLQKVPAAPRSSQDQERLIAFGARIKSLFTRDFLEASEGAGHPSDAPVFVLGVDAAAVAEVERRLAGESETLGAAAFLPKIADYFPELRLPRDGQAPGKFLLGELSGQEIRLLAQGYLDRVVARLGHLPKRFIDAQPHNWAYIGLIRLLLPEARIVHAVGGGEPTALSDVCADIVAHFEQLAPGAIRRVHVDDDEPLPSFEGGHLAEAVP